MVNRLNLIKLELSFKYEEYVRKDENRIYFDFYFDSFNSIDIEININGRYLNVEECFYFLKFITDNNIFKEEELVIKVFNEEAFSIFSDDAWIRDEYNGQIEMDFFFFDSKILKEKLLKYEEEHPEVLNNKESYDIFFNNFLTDYNKKIKENLEICKYFLERFGE